MVAFSLCAGCMSGLHENHNYWIQKPPKGVMGGWACRCGGDCAGNGEKLLESLFPGIAERISTAPKHRADVPVDSCAVGREVGDSTPCYDAVTYVGRHRAEPNAAEGVQ